MLTHGNRANGLQLFLGIGIGPTPAIWLNKVTSKMPITSLKNFLSTFKFFPVSFFTFLLFISTGTRTKLKKI